MTSRRTFLAAAAATAAASAFGFSVPALAKSGTTRVIVPFPAGGGGDALARTVVDVLARQAGSRILVDNRPGAGGNVGTRLLTQAKPDGLTLGYVTNGILCVNKYLYGDTGFDTNDLIPVGLSTEIGLIAVLNPKAIEGVTDLASLIAYAKANPGKVDFASSGNGTTSHLAGLFFGECAGVKLTHIPYRGGAAAMLDVLSGRIPLMIDVAPNALQHVAAGKLTALATPSRERLPSAPDVPTFAEAGVPGFELSAWDGFVLPKGTPDKIVRDWNRALVEALSDEDLRRRLAARGADVRPGTPEAFRDFIASEAPKWEKLVKTIRAERT